MCYTMYPDHAFDLLRWVKFKQFGMSSWFIIVSLNTENRSDTPNSFSRSPLINATSILRFWSKLRFVNPHLPVKDAVFSTLKIRSTSNSKGNWSASEKRFSTLQAPVSTYQFSTLISIHFLKELGEKIQLYHWSIFSLPVIILLILITCISLVDVWMLLGENWCWSLSFQIRMLRLNFTLPVIVLPRKRPEWKRKQSILSLHKHLRLTWEERCRLIIWL